MILFIIIASSLIVGQFVGIAYCAFKSYKQSKKNYSS